MIYSRLFPSHFPSYEVLLRDIRFTTLRAEDSSFLTRVTELNIVVALDVNLDLRYLASLRNLSISCSSNAWQTMQCRQLEQFTLNVWHGLNQLHHPISAKYVKILDHRRSSASEVAIAKVLPDSERVSFISPVADCRVLTLDGSHLRRLEVLAKWRLVATEPIHLSSLSVPQAERVSEHITASRLVCNQITVASHMGQHLRELAFRSGSQIDHDLSMLTLPRSIKIDCNSIQSTNLGRVASFHMLLNRCIASQSQAAMVRVQELVLSWLTRGFDEGLLLRVLKESHCVSTAACTE